MTRRRGAALRSDETIWAIRYLEENPRPIRKDDFRDLVAARIPPGRAIRKYQTELDDRQRRRALSHPELPPLVPKPESEQIKAGASRLAQQTLGHMAVSGHMLLVKENGIEWYIPFDWEGEMPTDDGSPQRAAEDEDEADPSPHPGEAPQDDDEASEDVPATAGETRSQLEVSRETSTRMRKLVEQRDVTFVRVPVGTPVARNVSVIDGTVAKTVTVDRRLDWVENPSGGSVLTKTEPWAEEELGTLGRRESAPVEEAPKPPKQLRPVRYNDFVAVQVKPLDTGPDDGGRLPLGSGVTAGDLLPIADPHRELAETLLSRADRRVLSDAAARARETQAQRTSPHGLLAAAEAAVDAAEAAADSAVAAQEEVERVKVADGESQQRVKELETQVEVLGKLVENQADTIATLAAGMAAIRELLVPRCGWSWDERSNDPSPMPCTAVAHYRVVERRNKGMGVTDVCPRHAEAAHKRGLVTQPLIHQSPHMLWPLDPSRKTNSPSTQDV